MMFSQCNTCSVVIYLTIQYQGECGHIDGHAAADTRLSSTNPRYLVKYVGQVQTGNSLAQLYSYSGFVKHSKNIHRT